MKPIIKGLWIGIVLGACWLGGAASSKYVIQHQFDAVIAKREAEMDTAVDQLMGMQLYIRLQTQRIQQLEKAVRWLDNQRTASR